ncbi:MAG: GEVED domain-containing protein [Candidatus Thermoplasmatota archaeon]
MSEQGDNGSLLLRVLSDRDIQIASILLSLALIFAFVGALPEGGRSIEKDTIEVDRTLTTYITVPEDAQFGKTMMRVMQEYGEYHNDPSGNQSYGETEDYTVVVGEMDGDLGKYSEIGGGNTSYDEYITNVQFNGIDRDSGDDGGYADHTDNISDPVEPGETYKLSVTVSNRGYSNYVTVVIDWYQNHNLTNEEVKAVGNTDDDYSYKEIDSYLTAIDNFIDLNYSADSSTDNAKAKIWFEDDFPYEEDSERIRINREGYEQYDTNITLRDGENFTQDITKLEERPRTVNFNLTGGQLEYSHTITYETKPYGLLSFPALVFLLIGMVYAFRGKGVIAAELKRKRMLEEERSQESTKEEEKEEEEIEDEKTIYPGNNKQKSSHVDFMGISDSSEDEKKEE